MNFKNILIGLCLLFSTVYAQETSSRIVSEIRILGLKNVTLPQLPPLSSLNTRVGKPLRDDLVQKDLNHLYLTGYFQEINVRTTPASHGVHLEFMVTENPVINGLIVTGNRGISSWRLRQKMSLKKGDFLNLRQLQENKIKLESEYIDNGYSLMEIDTMTLDEKNNLVIRVSEGTVGETYFDGLKKIKPFVLHRELRLKPGKPFNTIHLRQDRDRLSRLGFFSNVTVPTIEIASPTEKIINIRYGLQERKTNLLDFGLEQRQDIVVTFLRTDFRHVLAHTDTVTIKIQAQPNINNEYRIRSYRVSYHQPWFLNRYGFSFTTNGWTDFNQEFQTIDRNRGTLFHTQRNGYDVGLGFPLIRDHLLFTTKLKNEDVKTEPGSTPVFASYQIQSLNAGLSFSHVDNILNPHIGGYWACNFEKGGNLNIVQLNGLNFSRFTMNAAGFIPLSSKATFGTRVFTGIYRRDEVSIDTFDAEGFVLGGANSLRGYKELHNPLTGNQEVLFNIEYRYAFSKLIHGVLFYDIGQTYSSSFTIDLNDMETGYGFGIRFMTALAPIRFDFSWGRDFLIQFGLGHMF